MWSVYSAIMNTAPTTIVSPPAQLAESARELTRLIAFHLPQFHPIPENDEWWGKGFTEWTNVTKARPLFRGHAQPRLPGELGFYDLRLSEARAAQAELARDHGIEGFCYWHYWFHGRRLLERPIDEILVSGEPDFPFCLAWANEQWSRSWLGDRRHVLIEQTYSAVDDEAHGRWLARAFADPRYIRIDGRPMFLIYKPRTLPDPRRTTDTIRHESVRQGLSEPYLVGIDAHSCGTDMRDLGFDMTEHHSPQLSALPMAFEDGPSLPKLRRNLRRFGKLSAGLKLYDYADAVRRMAPLRPAFPYFPCCFAGWDNTARRGPDSIVMVGSTPTRFREILAEFVQSVAHKPAQERVIFINAWNEWAEGMYLEPDRQFGRQFLEAVASVQQETLARQ